MASRHVEIIIKIGTAHVSGSPQIQVDWSMSQAIDNLNAYETAVLAMDTEPNNPAHKHAAVLALARAGSLDFALSEYMRLGLNDIRHHEDIMALGGRLYKDLYLSHQGSAAKEFARLSAEKYEEAYQDTSGFYSGINAATMSLLGGVPAEMIEMRAQRILQNLLDIDGNETDIYFTEATRAEAYFLLGDADKAWVSLKNAINYDPLNFTAHASTLKQFAMIARARGEDTAWLSEITPPRAVQFAGHIFGIEGEVDGVPVLSQAITDELADKISDIIQVNDIGFGFGALAAGADIMIAECLLEEGGELHVILPVEKDAFVAASVAPFGKSWTARFEACLAAASSIVIFDDQVFESQKAWPDNMLQHRGSMMAMGGAIRRANELMVKAGQLLIWDGKKGAQGTAFDAQLWHDSGRPQYVLPYTWPRNAKPHGKGKSDYRYQALLSQSGVTAAAVFGDLHEALKAASLARNDAPNIMQAISLTLRGSEDLDGIETPNILSALPGAIHVNELAANYIAVHHNADYEVSFMGLNDNGLRIFALQERG